MAEQCNTEPSTHAPEVPQALTQREIDQRVFDLYDEYCHGRIDRREFLLQAAAVTIGGLAMAQALLPRYALAQTISFTDQRIKARYVTYPSPGGTSGTMRGYLVQPNGPGPFSTVLVIHENRGLNPHIEDIARRVALDGFMAFAPDALFPLGGYPGDEDKAREVFPKLDQAKTREDFVEGAKWLKGRVDCTGKVAAVGFCYGGSIANMLATRLADLRGAVPFYGGQPKAEEVPNIKAPLLLHYAENDERVNAGWPAYETALKANKVSYEAYIYPGTQHGFNNDTTPRYNKDAATLAWQRTIDFFKKNLKS
jgi:carboxymethylenebutenolidase